ncbi:MAG: hypothetical protein KME60_23100 [Cyanomargarita calcarea GSE-NOS-MK-12-04C]|jgi:hypothetical protein|uniref:Uncharacterized protein n=1 Tax=Cyanomargarita calcarea GSE-NOS-MK-12-04C TaxID=2839659 RepID=A0A951QPN6_9CYAN|nr:hypothetical protein [Cyanomargarita calcarea GSE-NOS-MK-12-04C]
MKEEGRRKKEEGRWGLGHQLKTKDHNEGRRKKEEGRRKMGIGTSTQNERPE